MRLAKWVLLIAMFAPLGMFADTALYTSSCTGTTGTNLNTQGYTTVQGTWVINTNTCINTVAPGNANATYRSADGTYTQDQYITVKSAGWLTAGATQGYGAPAINIVSKTMYSFSCVTATSGTCSQFAIRRTVTDSISSVATITATAGPTNKVTLRRSGSVISLLVDGVSKGSYTDGSALTGGAPGLSSFMPFTATNGFTYVETGNVSASETAPTISGTASAITITGTSGDTFCWTDDGTTPTANGAGTCTHGTTYTAPFATAGTSVKAIASKSGSSDSSVTTYSIKVTQPVVNIITRDFHAERLNYVGMSQ